MMVCTRCHLATTKNGDSAYCKRCSEILADKMTDLEKVRAALLVVLDNVDYTNHACGLTDMVGACLPAIVIDRARQALEETKHGA